MTIFKYYRPNAYFEKAVRYNEIYFAANHELNDPNDLKASYYFEDDPELWKYLLSSEPISPAWNILLHLSCNDEELKLRLNEIFKDVKIDSLTGSVREAVKIKEVELLELFERSIIEHSAPPDSGVAESASKKDRARLCILILTELIARAINHQFYSVSFSKNALDSMMWAHYADGFKGCVVIYGGLDGPEIKLRHHLMSDTYEAYPLREVKYIDSDKLIPILECATKGKAKVEEAFLQKNSFWKYEGELRMFTTQEGETHYMAASDIKLKSPRQRIMHHGTNFITGIIFGPRIEDSYQRYIEATIADNREYADEKLGFFSFNTVLEPHGKVKVSAATKIIDRNLGRRVYQGEEMQKLLADLRIT